MKRPVIEQHVVVAVDDAEQVALADVRAGGAADVDLPLAAVDRDGADVLDQRLGAVARAARGRELELAGAVEAAEAPLDLERERHAVAEPEAAVVDADAALAGAVALAPGVARRHAEVAPDARQIVLRDADQIDALAAGQLDQRHVVLVGDVGDAAQLVRRADAARHLRDDREGAVLLDVGVHAIVDEARVALVDVLACSRSMMSSDASAGLLPASSTPPASASNTAETEFRPCSRIASISSGLRSGIAGHVVVDRGILLDLAAAEPRRPARRPAPCTRRSPCPRASPPSPA